jgi:hypothetical protein
MSMSSQLSSRMQLNQHTQAAHASLSQIAAAMEGPPPPPGQPTGGPSGPRGPHDDPLVQQALVHVRTAQQQLAQAMRILGAHAP